MKYKLSSEVTLYPGMSGWHFGHIDQKVSAEIREKFHEKKARGFASLRVELRVGETSWKTSIFPDKKTQTYLFPIKAKVRKNEGIFPGKKINYILEII